MIFALYLGYLKYNGRCDKYPYSLNVNSTQMAPYPIIPSFSAWCNWKWSKKTELINEHLECHPAIMMMLTSSYGANLSFNLNPPREK
jgi:hypothetical protein